ncbi:MAG TPA: hypothetical protein VFQ61_08635 [Polyangiaceae bacterium]|nr:hypothetical protein [Polyangiaceae bacterium]
MALLAFAFGACSADESREPEPYHNTVGSFLARESEAGRFELLHVLASLSPEAGGRYLLMLQYASTLQSVELARQLAQNLPTNSVPVIAGMREADLIAKPVTVVWFRTPTEAELDVLR